MTEPQFTYNRSQDSSQDELPEVVLSPELQDQASEIEKITSQELIDSIFAKKFADKYPGKTLDNLGVTLDDIILRIPSMAYEFRNFSDEPERFRTAVITTSIRSAIILKQRGVL
ncbi:MAG: hypothetical protein WCK98_04870 [bacterium]